jgi:hypothetical protein
MREIESLVEASLIAERDLIAAVDASGGTVPLPNGRTVTVGRAEFDSLLGERRKRAWVGHHQKASADAGAAMTARRLQPFRHPRGCSGCFRLERLPGGACSHWKTPPYHGA